MEKKKELSQAEKRELIQMMEAYEERQKIYWITRTLLQPHQSQLIPSIVETIRIDKKSVPKYKFILFQGWNWSWKSFTWLYATSLLAIWDECRKYKLPYIWKRRLIWIVTKSSSNVTWVIEPYLLWDYSWARIPPELISKVVRDNSILKRIILKNWTNIEIRTYDQWRERLQGWNPDFILVDEEPTDKWVWEELMVRARNPLAQIVLTMTPLSWLTPVYEFFYEWQVEEWEIDRRKIFVVSSLENKFADHSWLMFLSEQDRLMRIYWAFVPPEWIVYSSFIRSKHMVSHFNPKDLWDVKYYWWIDFWVTHPTGFVLVAVDWDWNHYAFDGFLKSNMLLSDIASSIRWLISKYWIELEYIVWDSAAKRERTELAKLWIRTKPADKWSKWENGESNRKSSILKINQLFASWKLYISDTLKDSLVKELEQHSYKKSSKDWEVIKEWDDILDALRYLIWSVKTDKIKTTTQIKFENKYWVSYNKKWYYKTSFKQPY